MKKPKDYKKATTLAVGRYRVYWSGGIDGYQVVDSPKATIALTTRDAAKVLEFLAREER